MDAYCTCGSPLPEGAAFCPRCGRPLVLGVGEPVHRREIEAASGAQGLPGTAGLGAGAYLRAAIVPALCAIFLRFVVGLLNPLFGLLSFLIFGGAGYAAVRAFETRNGAVTGVWRGCGIGALTGLLCFLALLATQVAVIAAEGREAILGQIREQAEALPGASDLAQVLEDPFLFAITIAFSLFLEAVFVLVFSSAGGAIAVKVRASGSQ